ncbi:hypothetical protein AMCSP13_000163 [Streptococcus pneumoniae 2070335]|nr:hypothetical protein AMCSP13_000163 [Streptococcus pneumoniae 2070335]
MEDILSSHLIVPVAVPQARVLPKKLDILFRTRIEFCIVQGSVLLESA